MPDSPRPSSRRKRVLRLVIFALVCFIVLLYGGMIAAYVVFSVQDARGVVCCNGPTDWGAPSYEDIAIASTDGVTLAGWYMPPQASADAPASTSVIILLHGYGSNRLNMGEHAAFLNAAGYGVLMVDMRGHGESTGGRRINGWPDTADVAALVEFLAQRPEVAHIGVIGFSTGAQVAARAGADLPQIEALVLDGPSPATGRDVRPLVDTHPWYGFWYVSVSLADRLMALTMRVDVPEAVVDALDRIEDRPVLVIAGAAERPEPDYAKAYRDALGDNGELWLIDGATHGQTWRVAPD